MSRSRLQSRASFQQTADSTMFRPRASIAFPSSIAPERNPILAQDQFALPARQSFSSNGSAQFINDLASFATQLSNLYQQQLQQSPHSPGDPFMWNIHADLPEIVSKLFLNPSAFDSPSMQPSLLSIQAVGNSALAVAQLLVPTSAFIQYLLKSAAEPVFYEVGIDSLPSGLQQTLIADHISHHGGPGHSFTFKSHQKQQQLKELPAFIRNRLIRPPVAADPSLLKLRLSLAEFFLLKFLYVPLYSISSRTPNSALSSSSSLYSELLVAYLDYFLPWREVTPDGRNSLPACIFDCTYIDRNTQLSLSQFFFELICELWMGPPQLQSAPIEPLASPTIQFQPAISSLELDSLVYATPTFLQLVHLVESHILSMNLSMALTSSHMKFGSFEELSLWNPLDWLQAFSYRLFKVSLYQLLRHVLISMNGNSDVLSLSMESFSRLLFSWLAPQSLKFGTLSENFNAFAAENLPFYTVIMDEYLALVSLEFPLNGVLTRLARVPQSAAEAQIISSSVQRDIQIITRTVENIYRPDIVEWLARCEQILVVSSSQQLVQYEMNASSNSFITARQNSMDIFADDDFNRIAQLISYSYSQMEPNCASNRYRPVIGTLSGGGGKLLKRLSQFEVFLTHIYSLSSKNPAADVLTFDGNGGGWLASLFKSDSGSPWMTHVRSQLEAVCNCNKLLLQVFNGKSEDQLILEEWRNEGKSLVNDAMMSSKLLSPTGTVQHKAGVPAFQHPDSKPIERTGKDRTHITIMKLTERGRKQIRNGEQKCSNRDFVEPKWDPSDLTRIKSTEIEFLVRGLVYFGQWLNARLPILLKAIDCRLASYFETDSPLQRSLSHLDFCYIRVMASRENILFVIIVYLLWCILRIIFG